MTLILEGLIAPFARDDPEAVVEGRLYIGDDGLVASVAAAGEAAPAGFVTTPVVAVGDAVIYPGLVDLHSHIGYNALPLWAHPGEARPFLHNGIWPGRASYKPRVSWPAWVLAKAAPEALLAYVQVRALAGGTTTIQGWPTVNRNPTNQLVRSADDQRFPDIAGGADRIRTSALPQDMQALTKRADEMGQGLGFIYHCAEGQPESLVTRQFEELGTANCLRERLIAIHCCAVGEAGFRKWRDRAELAGDAGPGTVVWSPFSNLWLYGHTTDVPAARRHGIAVCLGSDWGPSGSKNLLGELKVARLWSEAAGWGLSAFDLAAMATAVPGDALARCWGRQVGRLVPGACADVAVIVRRDPDPFENLIRAREEDVTLVLVGGRAVWGTKALADACGTRRTTSVPVGAARRRVPLTDPADRALPPEARATWTWTRVLAALDAVRSDPAGAVDAANAPTASAGRPPFSLGPEGDTLILELDMPGAPGGLRAGPPPPGAVVEIEPFPSLRHDRNWRLSIRGRGFHGGLLDRLDRFYAGP